MAHRPLVIGLVIDRRRWAAPAVTGLAAALLTQLVYPVLYDRLILADGVAAGILTARNVLLVALLVWAVVRVARVPRRVRPRTPVPSTTP
nr:hypothetical protein GCM10025699_20530 [Microbacterium flavescens]